ncbi:MAG: diaminopimelate epimerase [Clostridia bacterium]|nr:diaminopimelate epimerase [Clostridia bacterium]
MKFTKMHGIGNDYIYFNCFENNIENPSELSVKLSRRRFSIGGDGIIMVCPSDIADAKMRIFNADGSEAKMCGNGIRCVGKFLYDKGIVKKDSVSVETLSGIKYLDFKIENDKVAAVTVKMGKASFSSSSIPVICETPDFLDRKMNVNGTDWICNAVSMGNPHLVVFCENIDTLNLEVIGPLFEKHEIFPESVNTEFIEVIGENRVKMRVWERGSGETFACGTGACAVAAVCVKKNIFPHGTPITVELVGGNLDITISENFDVTMSGPAETAYEGEIEI